MRNRRVEFKTQEGDLINLKKDFLGWRIVHPNRGSDGKMNWMNFLAGGKANLIKLIFILGIVLLLYFGINQLIANYKIIAEEPCKFCVDCFVKQTSSLNVTLPLG